MLKNFPEKKKSGEWASRQKRKDETERAMGGREMGVVVVVVVVLLVVVVVAFPPLVRI